MPTTLTSTMSIALGALQTNQTALSTTSHNISNVNSDGFVRQQVMTTSTSIDGFGNGVQIGEIRRTTDQYLAERVTSQKAVLSYAQTYNNIMENVEVVFGTPGSATSTEKLVNNFFNQFSTLANSPDLSSLKLGVVKGAELVVDTVQAINRELTDAQNRADEEITSTIVAINESLRKISDLNLKIVQQGKINGGGNANDLIDERQRQIDFISEKIKVDVTYDSQGRAKVQTESGRRLVDISYVQLERTVNPDPSSPYLGIGIRGLNPDGQPKNTVFELDTDALTSGSIKALVDVRDTTIENIKAEVNEFTQTLIESVNDLHSQGTGIPPKNSFTTGNGYKLSGLGADVTDPGELGIMDGAQFEVSVVDISSGDPVATTLGVPITINSPATLNDIANSINTDPNVGGLVTATTVTDAFGNPQLQITANDPNQGLVFGNVTGNPLGKLGMNNFFTGDDASSIAIRQDILDNPDHVATARMRADDGGVSFADNRNAIALAELASTDVNFDAAGSFAGKSDTIAGYFIGISSNLAIQLKDGTDREQFEQTIMTDFETRQSSVEGVNLDEELANMLMFQNAYQASARIISMVDEMMETIVNIL